MRPLGSRQREFLESLAPHHALINVRADGLRHYAALAKRGFATFARNAAGEPMQDFVVITAAGLAELEQADLYPRRFERARPDTGSPS